MNTTGKRIIQKTLAILVIFIMTMADWSIIGINLISYAVGDSEVNNENIAFSAYFDSESNTKEMTKTVDASDLKLIIELNVKNDGYLTGAKLELGENANFKFKTNLVDSHIKKIEENTIYLNQINEGDELKLQIGIEFANKEEMPIDYFTKESEINLTGSYINSKNVSNNQGQEITGKAKVKINWQSNQDTNSKLEAELLTNSIYKIEEANKKVVQVLIKSNIENNSYPVKNTNIKVNLPSEPESVEVHARNTDATNGNKEFTKGYADKELTINASNNIDNKIIWKRGVQDEYIVTLIYPEGAEITNQTINVASTITTYDEKTLEKQAQVIVNKEIDGIATVSQKEETEQIAKGKIYAGENKSYKTKTQLNIDYAKSIQEIELEEQTPKFIKQNEEKQANIQYTKTTIDKNEFLEIFGEEGTIQILDQEGNEAETITKETKANEQGKITIEYIPGTTSLKITTSKPITEGVLTLEHEKEILETKYSRAELQQITKIKDLNQITYTKTDSNQGTAKSEATLNLKETESKVTFLMDKQTLVDSQEQELTMQVTLLANSEERDLFKNPEVTIKMPEQIKAKSSNVNILYLNGLQLKDGDFKIDNTTHTIKVKLTGEQTKYPGNAITGTRIQIRTTLQINKLEKDASEKIKITYTNENATIYADGGKQEANINLIAQKKQQEEQEQKGETEQPTEDQTKNVSLNMEAKVGGTKIKENDTIRAGEIITYTVNITNSGNKKVSNLSLSATIPENTTLIEINPNYLTEIGEGEEVEEEEPYYIEKTAKTLEKQNISIDAGKTITLTYMVKTNTEISETKQIEATAKISNKETELKKASIKNQLTTSNLVATLIPILRTGEGELNRGFSYIYKLSIYNPTNVEQKNVKVTINKNDIINIFAIDYISGETYTQIEGETLTFTIGSIAAKDTAHVEIDAIIKNTNKNINQAEMSVIVKDSSNTEYRTIKLEEEISKISVNASLTSSATTKAKQGYILPGDKVKYTIKVKNTGEVNLNNLKIEDYISNYIWLDSITLNGTKCDYEEEYNYDEDLNCTLLTIETDLKVGEEKTLVITGNIDEDIEEDDTIIILNKAIAYNNFAIIAETGENEYYINPTGGGSSSDPNAKSISGTVWLDEDENGARDEEETLMEGINVYAIDVNTNKIAKDSNGNEIIATTNSEGKYTLSNLPKGEYIVAFEYDTRKYTATEYQAEGVNSSTNSDAVTATRIVENTEKTIAITDSINLKTNKSNIDLGLCEAQIFDLDLEKVISKIVITNKEGTKTYKFDDTNLAKTEIRAKNLKDSNVVIEYKMKIKNNGQIPGYAKSIVDYLPSSLKFNSNINKDWYQKDSNLYNDSLANEIINPGETKELTLILTKKMTESNTGLTNNKAEIAASYNEQGIEDIDSTTGGEQGTKEKQDAGSADILITPSTGEAVNYIVLILTTFIIIGGLAYIINKKILLRNLKI